jgi:hypothetical protein
MSQVLLPYTIETVEDAASLTARAGLPLVVETMRALGVPQSVRAHVRVRRRRSGYDESTKVQWLVSLLAAGGDCVEDIEVLRAAGGCAVSWAAHRRLAKRCGSFSTRFTTRL